jgi:transcription antitermination factor NusG
MHSPIWYTLQSKPRQEDTLWQYLRNEGHEVYYPLLPVRPANPRAKKIRPYFPGYMFVHIDIDVVGLVKFKWMPFSSGLVCFDDIPAPLPDHLIDGIRQTIDKLTCGGRQYYDELVHGQPVLVRSGPMEGYTGIFDTRLSGGERVRLLLDYMYGRTMVVEMDAARVEAISPRRSV